MQPPFQTCYKKLKQHHLSLIHIFTLTETYVSGLRQERDNAEDAIHIVKQIISGETQENRAFMKRKEVSEYLGISMDALRNWEMNGLLAVKRKENGYRIYTGDDIKRLKRCV